ncbi:hypothetical protein [Bradyrhizobium erythrophlei]|uniref:hypothetical protein n=1 Tax=Bradyrhizobium erythrophlei TaxID=1437360 RepID=UPI0012EB7EE4|nr:hypothetical protein [Bradyrhizobium erythrophlei]
MDSDYSRSKSDKRVTEDRRSGTDTRSDAEKQMIGERREAVDRRMERKTIQAGVRPTNEQLSLFTRRLRRALASERGREFFGVARSEYDFSIYPEVLRTLEWIESSFATDETPLPTEKITLRKALSDIKP